MLAAETKSVDVSPAAAASEPPSSSWKHIVAPAEPFLQAVADQLDEQVLAFDAEIATYARYALTNQGKQLRPALVALSGAATGNAGKAHVTVAVIIEMVHLATLVHDDIMDEASIRRQRPTLAANWGNQISVLLGDCLFAHSLRLAAGFPTPDICRAVATAAKTVCSGEILQTHRRLKFDMTRAEYFKVLGMKTAEFFALSCELGASLNGAPERERVALREYGQALGLAYQIYDDCVDLYGSEASAGKSLGTDLASGKLTLPVLIVLEQGDAADRARLRKWIENWQPGLLPQVVQLLEKHQALARSVAAIREQLEAARRALAVLPENEGRAALSRLTQFLTTQTEALGAGSRG